MSAASTSPRRSLADHAVVKELRRSSDLVRNVLCSGSSGLLRSSDSSDSNVKSTSPIHLFGCQREAANLDAALAAHRNSRWTKQPTKSARGPRGPSGAAASAELFEAVTRRDLNRTRHLLEDGDADANWRNERGFTALHWCVVQTPLPWSFILLLLEHGGRVELRDQDGTQPVFLLPSLSRLQSQLVNDAARFALGIGSLNDLRGRGDTDDGAQAAARGDPLHLRANLFRRLQQGAARKQHPLVKTKSSRECSEDERGCCPETSLTSKVRN